MDTIIGIDLGTTNSEVALLRDGVPVVLEEDGRAIVPSVVGYSETGELLVGDPALNQLAVYPERTVRSVKRRMGGDETIVVAGRDLRPQDISAEILRHLAARAERALGHRVQKAVITVPAFFNEAQRRATLEAGELAGLEVVRLLHEPTAASLVYDSDLSRARTVLVYDLGGGTFDVSIVRIENSLVEVLASHGDTQLGGDDFDELLLQHVLERFASENGVDLSEDPRALGRVRRSVEVAKCALSFAPYATIAEEFIAEKEGTPLNLSLEIARHEYESMIRPLVERTLDSVGTALERAGVLLKNVDAILLVGGATRTPLVARLLEERTGVTPRQDIHPDLCVALGAAVQGGMIAGERLGRVLVDVTAHSFGIRCLDYTGGELNRDHFDRIIPRGSPLPTVRSDVYRPVVEGQRTVEIEVYQGESARASENHELGTFRVEGLDEDAMDNPIVVQFRLTLDGTLTVSATEKRTGLSREILIDGALRSRTPPALPAPVPAEAVAAEASAGTAAESGEGAVDPTLDGAFAAKLPELQATIGRIRALFDAMAPDDRSDVEGLIARARERVEAGDLDGARTVRGELEDILFYVEEG